MKIISKYKDFYDYLWVDGDPDLIYVRKEKLCFNETLKRNLLIPRKDFGFGGKYIRTFTTEYVFVIGYTFGIYPFIYTAPALAYIGNSYKLKIRVLTKPEVDSLPGLSKNDQDDYITKLLVNELSKDDNINVSPILPRSGSSKYHTRSIYDDINEFCWKIENSDIFLKLQAPVFCVCESNLLEGTVYDGYSSVFHDKLGDIEEVRVPGEPVCKFPRIITNIVFNKLSLPITKYWYDELNNVNTYSNIENFLMTSKQEPEPVISNNGKIIAHGFDLKTSFRNIK